MSYLNYQIWTKPNKAEMLGTLLASGTINTSSTLSEAVAIPRLTGGDDDLIGVFEVYGSTPLYVIIRNPTQSVPAGTGAHATPDTQPRMLIRESSGSVSVLLPDAGAFAAVEAAAFS